MEINQYEIYWVDLEPTKGSELQKIRACIVVSPNEMNHHINTVIIAPLTSTSKSYPSRVEVLLGRRKCWIVLDQIRCIDKLRLEKRMGVLEEEYIVEVKNIIREMLVD